MEDKKILLDNIDKIHTTEMGIDRIKRNLKIDTADVVEYCKNKVSVTIFFRSLVIRNSQRSIPVSSKDIIRVF